MTLPNPKLHLPRSNRPRWTLASWLRLIVFVAVLAVIGLLPLLLAMWFWA